MRGGDGSGRNVFLAPGVAGGGAQFCGRHVHRLSRPEAAVLTGLERDVWPRPACRARGWRHPDPGVGNTLTLPPSGLPAG